MDAVRFGRNYQLFIQTIAGDILLIQMPITIKFTVNRNDQSSLNRLSLQITNLNETKRNSIQKDAIDLTEFRTVELRAGYGQNMIKIFSGNYSQCYSIREGTEWTTYIEATDGGFAYQNSISSLSLGPQYQYRQIIQDLIGDLSNYGIAPGALGFIDSSTIRSTTLYGPTYKLLNEMTEGKFFIDLGKAYVLNSSDALSGTVYQVSGETGLLGTPQMQQYIITFRMVFEPSLIIGQRIQLNSSTGVRFNGYYKVTGISHEGVISDAVNGDCTTTITVQFNDKQFGIIG